MVNKTLLYKLSEINNQSIKKMKSWDQRKRKGSDGKLSPNQKDEIKNKILLLNISGNNIVEMLKGIFEIRTI